MWTMLAGQIGRVGPVVHLGGDGLLELLKGLCLEHKDYLGFSDGVDEGADGLPEDVEDGGRAVEVHLVEALHIVILEQIEDGSQRGEVGVLDAHGCVGEGHALTSLSPQSVPAV